MAQLKNRNDEFNYVFLDNAVPHYSLKEQFALPRIIKSSGIDLLHVPHFNAPLNCPVPFVVTIHDLILHKYPNEASCLKRMAYKLLIRNAVKKSKHIIAVSNYTADEIAKTYGKQVREKISVIYEGVSPEFRPVTPLRPATHSLRRGYAGQASKPFILYIGAAKQHKNVQTLIDACPDDMTLVLVTGGKEVAKLHPRSNTRIMENVSNEELPSLYSCATCFVTASLEEGFGLPALEAMACGCPVVASNRASLPEICGSHAVLVEPTVEGIRDGINEQCKMNNEQLRGELVLYAGSFSWEKMAEETIKIYQRTLGS